MRGRVISSWPADSHRGRYPNASPEEVEAAYFHIRRAAQERSVNYWDRPWAPSPEKEPQRC